MNHHIAVSSTNTVSSTIAQNPTNVNTIHLISYTKYDGVTGSFGQYGTGVIYVGIEGKRLSTTMTVAVKSHLSGQDIHLRRELDTLRRIQGMGIVPELYGTTILNDLNNVRNHNTANISIRSSSVVMPKSRTAIWGIVMQHVTISLNDWARGHSKVGSIELPDSRKSPKATIHFCTHFLTMCANSLKQLHQRGVTHHDIKPSNIGGVETAVRLPVKCNEGIRLLLFDFGLSNSNTWTCGTRPYSMKYWFQRYPGPKNDCIYTGVDYFQCLVVVMIYMVTWCNGSIDKKFFTGATFLQGAKMFGNAWLSSLPKSVIHTNLRMGWLQFFLAHTSTVCHPEFHNQFCSKAQTTYAQPAAGSFWNELQGLMKLDRHFSDCLHGTGNVHLS